MSQQQLSVAVDDGGRVVFEYVASRSTVSPHLSTKTNFSKELMTPRIVSFLSTARRSLCP